jgi:hypothetical protein
MVFTTRLSGGKGGRNGFEHELRRRGITQKNGKPGHPQTQGKAERFQQTLKNWLAAQHPQPADLAALQALLDTFTRYYNHQRPHRSLPHRATPATAYTGRPKSRPRQPQDRHPRPRPPRHHRHHRHGHLALRRAPLPHRHRPNLRRNPHSAARPRPAHPHRRRRHRRTAPPAHPRPCPQLPAHPAVTRPKTSTPAPKKKITVTNVGSRCPRCLETSQGAPSRIRTCGLLLRSNPGAHAVAISDDAGQVRGGSHCCSPSYLVITSQDTGRTTGTEDAARIVSQDVATSRSIVLGQSVPARRLRKQS